MLIILDRDGVINEDSDDFIKNPDEWIPIKGSLEAIAKLNQAGHKVVIATNQSGVGRGLYDEDMLKAIHDKMDKQLAEVGGHIDGVFYCPHHPDDGCECRKPKPGMMYQIAEAFQANLESALFVGDAKRDIDSAHAANCKAILVRTGKGLHTLKQMPDWAVCPIYDDLASVVDAVLSGEI